MKIYAITKDERFLDGDFYATKDLAQIRLHALADKYRKEYGFNLIKDSFSYQSPLLPDDNGFSVRYATVYNIVDIIVEE
jgi:hypothetical protein